MGFVNNLARGFVRAAVNQVGRDGGKFISNKVYGNRHSTPIRIAREPDIHQGSEIQPETDEINIPPSSREELLSEGYKTDYFNSSEWAYPFILLGSIILPIIGPLYWIIVGSRNLFQDRTKFYTFDQEPVFTSDRRYKTGVRQAGFRSVKRYSDAVISPSGNERFVYLVKGIVALILALSILYLQYEVYQGLKS
ncbi:MAG: hypothetical protein ABIQ02_09045 [Saprospiraceae bacterium]